MAEEVLTSESLTGPTCGPPQSPGALPGEFGPHHQHFGDGDRLRAGFAGRRRRMWGPKGVHFTDYLGEPLVYAKHNWDLNCAPPRQNTRWTGANPTPLRPPTSCWPPTSLQNRGFSRPAARLPALCKPGGRILFSEPGREVAQVFLDTLPALGFEVKKTLIEGELNGIAYKVGVYELSPLINAI